MPCTKKDYCDAMKAVLDANTAEHGKGIGWQMYINFKTGDRSRSLVYRTKAGYAGKVIRLNYCPWCAELLSAQSDS